MVAYNRRLKVKWKAQGCCRQQSRHIKLWRIKVKNDNVKSHGQEEGIAMAGLFSDVFLCGRHNSDLVQDI